MVVERDAGALSGCGIPDLVLQPPSESELAALRAACFYANRFCKIGMARCGSAYKYLLNHFLFPRPAVDPGLFFAELKTELLRDGSTAASSRPLRLREAANSHLIDTTGSVSSAIRASYFLLLSVASRHRRDATAEAAYRKIALRHIDDAMAQPTPPTQHLVTALLLMALTHVFGLSGGGFSDASSFANVAHSLAEGVSGLSIEIGATATTFAMRTTALRFSSSLPWPALKSPIGASAACRATHLVSFIGMYLAGHVDVSPELVVSRLRVRRQRLPEFFSRAPCIRSRPRSSAFSTKCVCSSFPWAASSQTCPLL